MPAETSGEIQKDTSTKLGPTGRVIDISKFSGARRESDAERLTKAEKKIEGLMRQASQDVNARLESLGAPPLVGADGRLVMEQFPDIGRSLSADQEKMDKAAWGNFNLDKPQTHTFFVDEFRKKHRREPKSDAELLGFCRSRADQKQSHVGELVITTVLHRALGKRFVVVRSSEYDDLLHSADGYIVDTKTGARVCSLDHFTTDEKALQTGGGFAPRKDDRGITKRQKQEKIMQRGGTRLSYGFSIQDGKVELGKVKNIPLFIAEIDKKKLFDVVNSLGGDINGPLTEPERVLFLSLMSSLESQAKHFMTESKDELLKDNIQAFLTILQEIGVSSEVKN